MFQKKTYSKKRTVKTIAGYRLSNATITNVHKIA